MCFGYFSTRFPGNLYFEVPLSAVDTAHAFFFDDFAAFFSSLRRSRKQCSASQADPSAKPFTFVQFLISASEFCILGNFVDFIPQTQNVLF